MKLESFIKQCKLNPQTPTQDLLTLNKSLVRALLATRRQTQFSEDCWIGCLVWKGNRVKLENLSTEKLQAYESNSIFFHSEKRRFKREGRYLGHFRSKPVISEDWSQSVGISLHEVGRIIKQHSWLESPVSLDFTLSGGKLYLIVLRDKTLRWGYVSTEPRKRGLPAFESDSTQMMSLLEQKGALDDQDMIDAAQAFFNLKMHRELSEILYYEYFGCSVPEDKKSSDSLDLVLLSPHVY